MIISPMAKILDLGSGTFLCQKPESMAVCPWASHWECQGSVSSSVTQSFLHRHFQELAESCLEALGRGQSVTGVGQIAAVTSGTCPSFHLVLAAPSGTESSASPGRRPGCGLASLCDLDSVLPCLGPPRPSLCRGESGRSGDRFEVPGSRVPAACLSVSAPSPRSSSRHPDPPGRRTAPQMLPAAGVPGHPGLNV